jgi:hypothetical protein
MAQHSMDLNVIVNDAGTINLGTKFQNLFCNCLLQSLKFVMRIVQKIQAALVKPCRLESMPNYEIKKAKSREAPFNL